MWLIGVLALWRDFLDLGGEPRGGAPSVPILSAGGPRVQSAPKRQKIQRGGREGSGGVQPNRVLQPSLLQQLSGRDLGSGRAQILCGKNKKQKKKKTSNRSDGEDRLGVPFLLMPGPAGPSLPPRSGKGRLI